MKSSELIIKYVKKIPIPFTKYLGHVCSAILESDFAGEALETIMGNVARVITNSLLLPVYYLPKCIYESYNIWKIEQEDSPEINKRNTRPLYSVLTSPKKNKSAYTVIILLVLPNLAVTRLTQRKVNVYFECDSSLIEPDRITIFTENHHLRTKVNACMQRIIGKSNSPHYILTEGIPYGEIVECQTVGFTNYPNRTCIGWDYMECNPGPLELHSYLSIHEGLTGYFKDLWVEWQKMGINSRKMDQIVRILMENEGSEITKLKHLIKKNGETPYLLNLLVRAIDTRKMFEFILQVRAANGDYEAIVKYGIDYFSDISASIKKSLKDCNIKRNKYFVMANKEFSRQPMRTFSVIGASHFFQTSETDESASEHMHAELKDIDYNAIIAMGKDQYCKMP